MTGKKIIALKKWPYDEEKKKFEKNDNKKNTIYFKGKGIHLLYIKPIYY
jgi:hypothetical protein